MNRFRLRVVVAVITFVSSAGIHQGIVSLAWVTIRYEAVALKDPSITMPEKFDEGNASYERRVLVISMPETRELYVGKKLGRLWITFLSFSPGFNRVTQARLPIRSNQVEGCITRLKPGENERKQKRRYAVKRYLIRSSFQFV